ncbi:protein TolQ [Larsenimonas rhizosphaerae]|uniref:Tol-Pal system protein TolQ n=1 Tax=Larsenimonas rhizosphaerae TaxID=2944682 RepID=A0AA41ZK41_9GAMM|nr:protein TolQ [Larsenimonas rhizosphaerae]MCM2130672.1 protein TolQ [Larsenimonas rhizosphaerae]MCX2523376.1 protein TolQ [Larsenimonas rhizosphaerae]
MNDSMSIVSLFLHASLIVQVVMLILLAASVLSWILIFRKTFALRAERRQYDTFEERFWSGVDLNELYRDVPSEGATGAAHVFRAGFREFNRLMPKARSNQDVMDGVQRAMRVALSREEERLNEHLPILATISSASPYIGLFGTVWGIMGSFQALANAQQATLATVAPWIAEALVATAMGLFAAIPAVIFYNRLSTKSDRQLGRLEDFAEEFHSILHRNVQSRAQDDAREH